MTGKFAELRPSPRTFADFLCETCPHWDRSEVEGALTAAGNNRRADRSIGEHWAATVLTVARVLATEGSMPRDVLAAVTDLVRPVHGSVRATADEVAEYVQARDALAASVADQPEAGAA